MRSERKQVLSIEEKMLNTPLKEATITIRYTNLLLCGLPDSSRSSFYRLLLNADATASVPPIAITRMMMRTPELKLRGLSTNPYEWEMLEDSTFQEILASHFSEASEDMPKLSLSKPSLASSISKHSKI